MSIILCMSSWLLTFVFVFWHLQIHIWMQIQIQISSVDFWCSHDVKLWDFHFPHICWQNLLYLSDNIFKHKYKYKRNKSVEVLTGTPMTLRLSDFHSPHTYSPVKSFVVLCWKIQILLVLPWRWICQTFISHIFS